MQGQVQVSGGAFVVFALFVRARKKDSQGYPPGDTGDLLGGFPRGSPRGIPTPRGVPPVNCILGLCCWETAPETC